MCVDYPHSLPRARLERTWDQLFLLGFTNRPPASIMDATRFSNIHEMGFCSWQWVVASLCPGAGCLPCPCDCRETFRSCVWRHERWRWRTTRLSLQMDDCQAQTQFQFGKSLGAF